MPPTGAAPKRKTPQRRVADTPHPVPHPVPQGSVTVRAATLVAALALAACSAAFSISGLTSIFAGAFWAVIGLGVAFEIGKLSAVAWLGQQNVTRNLLRLALAVIFIYHGFVKVTGKDNTWGASWATEAWNQQADIPKDVAAKLDKLPRPKNKAEAECAWFVQGQRYEFCCTPCLDKFIRWAHNEPGKIKNADEYVFKGGM